MRAVKKSEEVAKREGYVWVIGRQVSYSVAAAVFYKMFQHFF